MLLKKCCIKDYSNRTVLPHDHLWIPYDILKPFKCIHCCHGGIMKASKSPSNSRWSVPLITPDKYISQNTLQLFSFSCKQWIPKANRKTIAPIKITNKISKRVLVVVFSRCVRGTGHWNWRLISVISRTKCTLMVHFVFDSHHANVQIMVD